MDASIDFSGVLKGSIADGDGGDTVIITPLVTSGTKIADVSVNGVEKDLYCPTPPAPTEVDITPVVTSGTKIADVSIGGVEKDLYTPDYETDIAALDGRLDTAEGNITSLTGRVGTAEGNITSLTGRVGTAEGNITNLAGRMTEAETDITALGIECDVIATDLAAPYDEEKTYSVGDYCTHDKVLYICNTDISTLEEWNISHWDAVKVMEDITEIKQSLSNLGLVCESIVNNETINSSETTYNTFNGRKFSDYSVLIFIMKYTDTDMRASITIPQNMWKSDAKLPLKALHDSTASGASAYNVGGMTFIYNSDTKINMFTNGTNTFSVASVVGVKLGYEIKKSIYLI